MGLFMSKLKVFISSTCYDLGATRKKLHDFIESIGYEPVCSDHNEVMYNPEEHSHESCVKKVDECDFFIYIISGRFGGEALPQVNSLLKNRKEYKNKVISITQAECMRAIQKKIPRFVFIKNSVLKDHKRYCDAKGNIEAITFKSIEKQKYAKNIFEFFDFLRKREINNAYFAFKNVDEIINVLKGQWSEYFQKLLDKNRINELMTEKQTFLFQDLKMKYDCYNNFFEEYSQIYDEINDFQVAPDDEWEDAAPIYVDRAAARKKEVIKLKKDYALKLPKDVKDILCKVIDCLNSYLYEIESRKMNIRLPDGLDRCEVEFYIEKDEAMKIADELNKGIESIKQKMEEYIDNTLKEIKQL